MLACVRLALAFVALAATHCGKSSPASPPVGDGAAQAPAPGATATNLEKKTLRGTITYRKVESKRMSVDAYLGDEILLVEESGTKTPLRPSDSVGKEALEALNGKKVEIVGQWSEGETPNPMEAHPMNPDGSPVRRRSGYRVLSIRPLD